MIEVKNLTKKYGSFTAIKDLNFTIEKGHVYGLLGPNGAGKSTTMNIMTGCLAATGGSVIINGYDIFEDAVKAKKNIGYLPEQPPLYPDMTPYEYLKFVAGARGLKGSARSDEIERVISLCGLSSYANRLIKNLSKGFRQRCGIAQALIGNPEIIILDEPTVGLDPAQLIEIRELISSLKEDHAVILSSHIMGEIDAVCDYIIIIAYGQIIASGTKEDLEGARCGNIITVYSRGNEKAIAEALGTVENAREIRVNAAGNGVKAVIEALEGYDLREAVFEKYALLGFPILEMTSEAVSLEDLFISLTNAASPLPENEMQTDDDDDDDGYSPLGSAYLYDTDDTDTDSAADGSDADGENGGYESRFSEEPEEYEEADVPAEDGEGEDTDETEEKAGEEEDSGSDETKGDDN